MNKDTNYSAQDIENTLQEYIIREFGYDRPEIVLENDLNLIEEGIIDSLGIFILIGFISDRFQVTIAPDEVVLENFETVNVIKSMLLAKLKDL